MTGLLGQMAQFNYLLSFHLWAATGARERQPRNVILKLESTVFFALRFQIRVLTISTRNACRWLRTFCSTRAPGHPACNTAASAWLASIGAKHKMVCKNAHSPAYCRSYNCCNLGQEEVSMPSRNAEIESQSRFGEPAGG